jgi:hypothetical protein
MVRGAGVEGVEAEFAGADLGDSRRTRRLQKVAAAVARAPDRGFPQVAASDVELEGIYRLFNNEAVTAEAVLEPHVEATLERSRAAGCCLAIHDTTTFEFGGEVHRDGLGLLAGNGHQQGFLSHATLMLAEGEARMPLGVVALRHLRRKERTGAWKHGVDRQNASDRESLRWEEQLAQVEKLRANRFECVHVMDREADIFDLLALARRVDARFVVRATHDRALADTDERVFDRISRIKSSISLKIDLATRGDRGRPGAQRKKHPARRARSAVLDVGSCQIVLKRPRMAHAPEAEVVVNVVRVWESSPVEGEPAVEWLLYTSEPVDTAEQLLRVVDIYRARWVIEEFFKALKTSSSLFTR